MANGYAYVVGGTQGISMLDTVYYSRIGGSVNVGGSLDLVGLQGGTLSDGGSPSTGSVGGSVVAGAVTAVGSLQVQSQALFANSVSVAGDFNAAGGLFSVSTGSQVVRVGPAVADSTAVILVLDNSSNEPSGIDGAMYYNTSLGQYRCSNNGAWQNCMTKGYTLSFTGTSHDPADGVLGYIGNVPAAPGGTFASRKIYIRKSGTIKQVHIRAQSVGAASTEPWTIGLKLNTDPNNVAVMSASPSGPSEWIWNATNTTISVSAGDFINVGYGTPTWATNPTGMTFSGYVYIE